LLNPVRPAWRVLGTSNLRLAPAMAQWLAQAPWTQQAVVVASRVQHLGQPYTLDELTPYGDNDLWWVTPGQVTHQPLRFDADGLGLLRVDAKRLADEQTQLGSVAANVAFFQAMRARPDAASPTWQTVCLNAAAGLRLVLPAMSWEEALAAVGLF
jgi:anthranilate phosphoribosyltransferase